MLYTSTNTIAGKKAAKMKQYSIEPNQGNDEVAPNKKDLDLFNREDITQRGFALNYEVKLRNPKAHEWMAKVSSEAVHNDVVLVNGKQEIEKICRKMLAEMMASMYSGKINFKYAGEIE